MHGNTRIYRGVRETPKEAREDRERPGMKGEREVETEGKSEEGR